jgi:hypothetical protein
LELGALGVSPSEANNAAIRNFVPLMLMCTVETTHADQGGGRRQVVGERLVIASGKPKYRDPKAPIHLSMNSSFGRMYARRAPQSLRNKSSR